MVLLAAGLMLLAVAGELWLRSTVPFMTASIPHAFVPGVGFIGRPGAEVRATNRLDFWQVSRFNREGFLDREPPRTEPAADACHVTVIGDSFVEAVQVPIADKLHVRLEVLARRGGLHVTTSAFGRGGTGQIAQLAYYDEFARKRAPGLIVLVFVRNDYMNNSPILTAVQTFRDPDRLPVMTAERDADGTLRLRPPAEESIRRRRNARRTWRTLAARVWRAGWEATYFGAWLNAHRVASQWLNAPQWGARRRRFAWVDELRKGSARDDPLLAAFARREIPAGLLYEIFAADPLPPPYAAELEYTAFALEQFRRRADRDGAALVILAAHHLRPGEPLFDRLRAIAGKLRIPVVSLHDHVVGRGGRIRDAHWRHNSHWSPAGHQWAAEAILEHLRRHPDVCARGPRRTPPPAAREAATGVVAASPEHAAEG